MQWMDEKETLYLRAFSAQHPQYYNLKIVLKFEISCNRHSGICTQFQLLSVSGTYNKGKPFQNVRFSLKLSPFQAEVRSFVFYFFYPPTVVRCIEKFTWHFISILPFVAEHSILVQIEIHSAGNITVICLSHIFIPFWLSVYFRSHLIWCDIFNCNWVVTRWQ